MLHSYSSQIYCEPIRLPHTPTQTATTYNLRPYKHVNKHAYLFMIEFMMELEKYRKAIASSVSALGYNKLKKEQEDVVLNFIVGNDVFAVLPTGFGKSLCYTCLPGVFDILLENPGYSIVVVVSPLTAIMKDQVWQKEKFHVCSYYK